MPDRLRQRALEATVAQAIATGLNTPEQLLSIAQRTGLPADDIAHLRAQPLRRLAIYPELVRSRSVRSLSAMMPRTAQIMGQRFKDDCLRFAANGPLSARFLRHLARPFLEQCKASWRADATVPACVFDLARHESSIVEVAASLDDPPLPANQSPPTLTEPVVFSFATQLLEYEYAVHRWYESAGQPLPIERKRSRVLLYRDAANVARCLELSPLAFSITTRLKLNANSLGDAVHTACAELKQTLDPTTINEVAHLLSDYQQRGIVR
jgi:hypothetical protein